MLRNDESYEYLYLPSSFGVCFSPSDPIKHSETAWRLATGNIPIKCLVGLSVLTKYDIQFDKINFYLHGCFLMGLVAIPLMSQE